MAGPFFDGAFFEGGFFEELSTTGARPADNEGQGVRVKGRYRPVKPDGLPIQPLPWQTGKRKTLTLPDNGGRRTVSERAAESAHIQAEVAQQVARDFGTDLRSRQQAEAAMLARAREEAITAEIAALLQKKMRTEDDEILLLMLMAATV